MLRHLHRRREKRRRVRSSYPLTHVLLDFQSVVGVDGSAIAVFEKLRRFAAREGVVLVLSGLGDRPELRRLTRIALYGETSAKDAAWVGSAVESAQVARERYTKVLVEVCCETDSELGKAAERLDRANPILTGEKGADLLDLVADHDEGLEFDVVVVVVDLGNVA